MTAVLSSALIPPATLRARRQRVAAAMQGVQALVFAGLSAQRNFPANTYPFRATSHFLFLVGQPIEGAVLSMTEADAVLYLPEPSASDRLWHGEPPDLARLAEQTGVRVAWLNTLTVEDEAQSLPVAEGCSAQQQRSLLGRMARPDVQDLPLSRAMVAARTTHDEAGIAELAEAATATCAAHERGLRVTQVGDAEWQVRASMLSVAFERGCTVSYQPIVTTAGNVLHQHDSSANLQDGDLLLVDFGTERPSGYACDVTRTWPVNGRFTDTQRSIYNAVLNAQRAAISQVRPGVRYRDVHLAAARELAQGLCDFGLLRGDPETLVQQGVVALFFPHGVGHLIGLDVHDMEDLGDLAGYQQGRARDPQFGLNHLRLDRELEASMAVTIEPGFYCVSAILDDPARSERLARHVAPDVLAQVRREVKGIRIEDVVLVAPTPRVLTEALVKDADAIEALVGTSVGEKSVKNKGATP